jgi:hypothetical protein
MGSEVVIGFREHTGWAAAVVLAGPIEEPALVERRRIELLDGELPANAYHVAQALERRDAARVVAEVREAAFECGARAVAELVGDLRAAGHGVTMAVVAESKPPPSDLSRILASHALLHAAEGELFRDVLVSGVAGCGLPVGRYPPKAVRDELADAAGLTPDAVLERLAVIGRAAGPPWREDQRLASMAAWLGLATRA